MMIFRFKRLVDEAVAPARAHETDAGWDVCAVIPPEMRGGQGGITVPARGRRAIPTGLQLQIPSGWMIEVRPRSGLARTHGLTVANSPGTMDAGYQGELMVVLVNHGDEDFLVLPGMRIGQLVPQRVPEVTFEETVEDEAETARGERGFGSTGA